jgi:hypothetical protein
MSAVVTTRMTKKRIEQPEPEGKATRALRITEEAWETSLQASGLLKKRHGEWVSQLIMEAAPKVFDDFFRQRNAKD